MKAIADVGIRQEFVRRKVELLEYARKKTTQKVNLFEKVQIPGFQEAVRKIKRFMEDEENLSKSSQKILKSLQEKRRDADGNGIDDADDAALAAADMQNKMKKGGEA